MTMRGISALILIAGVTIVTAACGVRGPLEPPVETTVIEGEAKTTSEQEEIHRGFILDGLLD